MRTGGAASAASLGLWLRRPVTPWQFRRCSFAGVLAVRPAPPTPWQFRRCSFAGVLAVRPAPGRHPGSKADTLPVPPIPWQFRRHPGSTADTNQYNAGANISRTVRVSAKVSGCRPKCQGVGQGVRVSAKVSGYRPNVMIILRVRRVIAGPERHARRSSSAKRSASRPTRALWTGSRVGQVRPPGRHRVWRVALPYAGCP
jgi:hypothetical protein